MSNRTCGGSSITHTSGAVIRTRTAGVTLGIRGLPVHALLDSTKAFYERHGCIASPTRAMLLMSSWWGP